MSTFTTPITILGTVQTSTGKDEAGNGFPQGVYQTYEVDISVNQQNHNDSSTRIPNVYDGIDIESGMYVSNYDGSVILKIISISDKSNISVTCVLEDEDLMSYLISGDNSLNGQPVLIFATNVEGIPIIVGDIHNDAGFSMSRIQSRFSQNETDDRLRFEHDTPPNVFIGDIVTVDTDGKLVKFGSPSPPAADISVGVVVDKSNGDKDIFVKPFNDVDRNYQNPEALLDGSPTDIYYTNPNSSGSITRTQSAGSTATFMQLNNAIATVQTVTKDPTTLPSTSDIIEINDIEIFNGPAETPPGTLTDWINTINGFSNSTHVTASTEVTEPVVDAENEPDGQLPYVGFFGNRLVLPVNNSNAIPANPPKIAISDGTNSVDVTFNILPLTELAQDVWGYELAQIVSIINTAISNNNNLNGVLVAQSYNSANLGHDALRIVKNTGSSATEITLTNITGDSASTPLVNGSDGTNSVFGLPAITISQSEQLILTRQSGGPIKISGTPTANGYINTDGFVSSNNGRIPYLLLIESSGTATGSGVGFPGDSNKLPPQNSGTGDNADTGLTITRTPFPGSNVLVTVNGVGVNVGDGDKNEDCYFSGDDGETAKSISEIVATDKLYWNSTKAGFELETTDDVDIIYDVSTRDL